MEQTSEAPNNSNTEVITSTITRTVMATIFDSTGQGKQVPVDIEIIETYYPDGRKDCTIKMAPLVVTNSITE